MWFHPKYDLCEPRFTLTSLITGLFACLDEDKLTPRRRVSPLGCQLGPSSRLLPDVLPHRDKPSLNTDSEMKDDEWQELRNDQSGGVNVAAGVAGRAAAMVKYSCGMREGGRGFVCVWGCVFLNTAVLRRLSYVRSQFIGRLRVFITPSARMFLMFHWVPSPSIREQVSLN